MLEPTDHLAAIHAVGILRDLPHVGQRAAETIVDHHSVSFEHKDGLRRIVLTGGWEVDPATAVRAA